MKASLSGSLSLYSSDFLKKAWSEEVRLHFARTYLTRRTCIHEERHLAELGLLRCTWQRLAIIHDAMMMAEGGRFTEDEKWRL